MATNFLTKIFGSRNDRLLKQYRKTVTRINAMEPDYEKLSDEQLRAKTQEFKAVSYTHLTLPTKRIV